MDSVTKRGGAKNPFADGGPSSRKNGYENVLQQSLEDENQVYIDVLSDNVRAIKQIAYGLKDHLDGEKKTMDDIGSWTDKSNKLLKFTNAKMDEMMSSKSGRVTCYLALFVIVFFFLLYILG